MPLNSLLETWVADQLITSEQADRILVRGDVLVRTPAARRERPHEERSSLVTEALGYLGGVIILVAAILIASLYWDRVGTTARLLIAGGVAVLLLAAGFAVPERIGEVGTRLRSVLWLVSTGALAGFLGLLGTDALDLAGEHVFLLVSSGVTAYAAGLWLISRTLVQQLVMMAGTMLTAAALTNELGVGDALPGFAVWGVGLIWMVLGWGGVLRPRQLVMAFGAAGAFAGAMTTIPTYAGIALALVTSVAVVATAVLCRDLLLLAVGALGTLFALPSAVIELFPGDLVAPIVMLVVGALLLGAGLFIARRRHTGPRTTARGLPAGTPAAAIKAATVAGVVVAAVIVTLAVT
ncbi:DUF2157 domain-containing protein [Nocardioides sp. YR527]|uniref:DUF2157 domain-containing protein n=1 Tax=Nocardioides sp. YR527 TaxID=1881028 RepID=UPI0015A02998|nr:DUF2157 domain-containing protein [Nocardioides sp. YR527]